MSIPAMALLRDNSANDIFFESQTAIIAPGVGAPIKAMNKEISKLGNNGLLGGRDEGIANAKIRPIVSGNSPVNAPTMAGRQKTGATST